MPDAPHTTRESFPAALCAALLKHGDPATLRDAVCNYVDTARARGEPVERVIIDLKQRCAPRARSTATRAPRNVRGRSP